jgi:quercetin dioxygenase-like cupin family protein
MSALRRPDEGRVVDLHNLRIQHKVTAADTGGAFSIVEHVIEPGILVKPHRHIREDEISIVLEGTIHARVGAEELEVPVGGYLVKKRGVPHAIWNMGPQRSRVAEIVSPAGFEKYFDEIEPILRGHGPEFDEQFYATAQRYQIEVLDDWSNELKAKYGLKL